MSGVVCPRWVSQYRVAKDSHRTSKVFPATACFWGRCREFYYQLVGSLNDNIPIIQYNNFAISIYCNISILPEQVMSYQLEYTVYIIHSCERLLGFNCLTFTVRQIPSEPKSSSKAHFPHKLDLQMMSFSPKVILSVKKGLFDFFTKPDSV